MYVEKIICEKKTILNNDLKPIREIRIFLNIESLQDDVILDGDEKVAKSLGMEILSGLKENGNES